MSINKKKIEKEFDEDKDDLDTVINKTKEVKTNKLDKHHEVVGSTKKIILPRGTELPTYHGKTLKINKRLHGDNYIAKAGTRYEEIPSRFRLRVSFSPRDFV